MLSLSIYVIFTASYFTFGLSSKIHDMEVCYIKITSTEPILFRFRVPQSEYYIPETLLLSAFYQYTENLEDYSDGKPQRSQFIHRTRNCSGNTVHIIYTGFDFALFKIKITIFDPIAKHEWEKFSLMMKGESYVGVYTGIGEKRGFELKFEIRFDGGNDFFDGENVDPDNFVIPPPLEVFYRDLPDNHDKPAEICFETEMGWHKLLYTNKKPVKNEAGRIRYIVLFATYLVNSEVERLIPALRCDHLDLQNVTEFKNFSIGVLNNHDSFEMLIHFILNDSTHTEIISFEDAEIVGHEMTFPFNPVVWVKGVYFLLSYIKFKIYNGLFFWDLVPFRCCEYETCHFSNILYSVISLTFHEGTLFKNCTKHVSLVGQNSYTQFVYVSKAEAQNCFNKNKDSSIISKN